MIRKNKKRIIKEAASENAEKVMLEQAQRIVELKKEINDLNLLLEDYRKREREIAETLAFAKKKGEEIVKDAKIKHALECERLRLYRNKWKSYLVGKYKQGTLAQDIERTVNLLKECQVELENTLFNDLHVDDCAVGDYLSERERLNDDPPTDYKEFIGERTDLETADILTEEELQELLAQLQE